MDQGKVKSMTMKIRVYGIVQGVGFRPLVYHMAKQEGIKGTVRNVGGYVEIVAHAEKRAIDRFLAVVRDRTDCGYEIIKMEIEEMHSEEISSEETVSENIMSQELPYPEPEDFVIIPSGADGDASVIPPDLPVCPVCQKELLTPSDRRYKNPFISCMSCGPRYTIIEALPYDRNRTTMSDFEMCDSCREEYTSPDSRRFHAQTISCNDCGPYLLYHDKKTEGTEELKNQDAFERAITVLLEGGILAVKGIGGYHFVCSPFREDTVNRLRKLKGREEKPFAVMFSSITEVKKYCRVSTEEKSLLESKPRPIVLLRREGDFMAPSTNKGSMYCGAFLPYTPLQIMLTAKLGPLIMTSANISDQPVIRQEEPMMALAAPELNGILYNTRRIVRSVDDSVARIVEGKPQLIRRSRGYVPYPVFISTEEGRGDLETKKQGIFAAGGDLKAAFCFCEKGNAVMSQHFGDLEETTVMEEYQRSYKDLKSLFRLEPKLAVCDLHPNYHSARFAKSLGIPFLEVQHHHAHIASVMAEHHLNGPVIGIALDGTGYGTDGTVWGGEFLVCENGDFTRAGHISRFPILGGDQSMRDAKKTAACCLLHWGLKEFVTDERSLIIKAALDHQINLVYTTSAGRLFDGAASVLNIAQENRYEGECGALFEKEAVIAIESHKKPSFMSFSSIETGEGLELDPKPVFKALCERRGREETSALALGFHIALAEGLLAICEKLKKKYQTETVCLSGGVFQNSVLTEQTIRLLRGNGFQVYMNLAVPPGDGGISLGQAYLGRKHLDSFSTDR